MQLKIKYKKVRPIKKEYKYIYLISGWEEDFLSLKVNGRNQQRGSNDLTMKMWKIPLLQKQQADLKDKPPNLEKKYEK